VQQIHFGNQTFLTSMGCESNIFP